MQTALQREMEESVTRSRENLKKKINTCRQESLNQVKQMLQANKEASAVGEKTAAQQLATVNDGVSELKRQMETLKELHGKTSDQLEQLLNSLKTETQQQRTQAGQLCSSGK